MKRKRKPVAKTEEENELSGGKLTEDGCDCARIAYCIVLYLTY